MCYPIHIKNRLLLEPDRQINSRELLRPCGSYIPEKRLIFISLIPRSRRTTQILKLQDQKNMPQSVFLINESL